MDDKNSALTSNVLPFRAPKRRKGSGARDLTTPDWTYGGPSPEESLRMMRAFLGIKNWKSRESLIALVERVSQSRGQMPEPANK